MAGHSKFANIKHKKEREDNKRGKLFTKLGREITVAVKESGKDVEFNPRLRLAIAKAKAFNMPKENIDRALKKGAGEGAGGDLEEVKYEGYGPGGVAFVVHALTDNRNRTASEVRHAFNKFGGSLGESGAVSWIFDRCGLIILEKDGIDEEEIVDFVLENGAKDFEMAEDIYIFCEMDKLYSLEKKCSNKYKVKEIVANYFIPKNFIKLDKESYEKVLKMAEHIENLDDVQDLYYNSEEDVEDN